MDPNNSRNKVIVSNYFYEDDNKSIFSLINNLKPKENIAV